MPLEVNYLIAANDSNLLDVDKHDYEYIDVAPSKQIPLCFPKSNTKEPSTFDVLVELMLIKEAQRLNSKEITGQTFEMLRCRLNGHVLAFFSGELASDINHRRIGEFISYLQDQEIGAVTINQYLGLLKRVLTLAVLEEDIENVPVFPKLRSKSVPRGSFSAYEYKRLLRISRHLAAISDSPRPITHRNTANGAFIKTESVPQEMKWLIGFMVNTFVRPVDIKLIQNKHIKIINGDNRYLRISMIETKRHAGQIVSMRTAVSLYKRILAYQTSQGFGGDEDYVFFPQVADRQGAISLISNHFKKILDSGNMAIGVNGEKRSLYSLRHTAITFRLLYGSGIDLLTLARNARTSVEMIERFYSSNLTAEMNIGLLHSKRSHGTLNKKISNL
jgi:integrase